MKMKEFLIAKGNPTLLVWNCPETKREKLIQRYLSEVEQIGFVSNDPDEFPVLIMMGKELCILVQPTKTIITIKRNTFTFTVTAEVDRIGETYD